MISVTLKTLLGSYHPNALKPGELFPNNDGQISSFDLLTRKTLFEEMTNLMKDKKRIKLLLEQQMGESFIDDENAYMCFEDLRNYFCNNGSSPDIYKYMD